jgi:hypothetical protein
MRVIVATALLLGGLGGLAACAGPQAAPPPPPVAAQPPPPPPGPPPAPPMAGPFAGHYEGVAMGRARRGCPREERFDITVNNGQVTGTASTPEGSADLTGNVGPTGRAVVRMAPQGEGAPRGTLVGRFVRGEFRGHTSAPCYRTLRATMGAA